MTDQTQEFYYEDFVTDISKFLKEKEHRFVKTAFDGYNSYVDENQLAILLSEFFIANQR